MKGKLIVIDGIDGSGKHTQAKELFNKLLDDERIPNDKIAIQSFPNYDSAGCTMVQKYLDGTFGGDPKHINSYLASTFYLIDQALSFKNDDWGKKYRNGGIVLLDRYYTSNIIHQGSKILFDEDNKDSHEVHKNFLDYITWIESMITRMDITIPDKKIWLMLDKKNNESLILNRLKDDNSTHTSDIHENDFSYLDTCRETLNYYRKIVENNTTISVNADNPSIYDFVNNKDIFINTSENGNMRSIESISNEIYNHVDEVINPDNYYVF